MDAKKCIFSLRLNNVLERETKTIFLTQRELSIKRQLHNHNLKPT